MSRRTVYGRSLSSGDSPASPASSGAGSERARKDESKQSAPFAARERPAVQENLPQHSSTSTNSEHHSFAGQPQDSDGELQLDILVKEFVRHSLLLDGHSEDDLETAGIGQAHWQEERTQCGGFTCGVPKEIRVARCIGEIARNLDSLQALALISWDNQQYRATALQLLHRRPVTTWHTIFTIYHFTAKIAGFKMQDRMFSGVLEVIGWLVHFTAEELLRWIVTKGGGWISVLDQSRSNKGFYSILAAILLTVGIILVKNAFRNFF